MKNALYTLTAIFLFTLTSAFAQNVWDGGGANANWDTANNWDDDTVPVSGASVTFLTGNSSGNTISLNGNRTSGNVTLNNTAPGTPNITFNGGIPSVWTINDGISKISAGTFTFSNSNLGIQLDADGMTVNHNASAGFLDINAPITGASSAVIRINDFSGGTPRAVNVGGNNTNFLGQWVVRRATLQVSGNPNTALGTSAANTITFQNNAGDGGNTVALNSGTGSVTWVNNFVNNNQSASGAEGAGIFFFGGSGSNVSLTLSGNFSSGTLQNSAARLYLGATTSNGANLSEGRIILTGDWSGYTTGGSTNGITLSQAGSIIINNASALANSAVGYSIAYTGTQTVGTNQPGAGLQMSAKLILGGAYTVNNNINFSGTGGHINSFGAIHSSGVATVNGQLSNDDPDGANVFSLNSGATLRFSGQVSSINATAALHINRPYTFNNGSGAATINPVGIVEFNRPAGISYTGNITVHAGTLLVNNTSGSGTGSGALTILANGTLGGNGIITAPTTISGTLAPGNSPGTLTINNNLVLNSSAILDWEINVSDTTVGGGINDLVTGVSNLTLDGTINFTLIGGPSITAPGTWRIFNYTGTLTDNTLNIGTLSLGTGLTASIDTSVSGQVNLVVIPEPAAWALMAVGWTGLMIFRRRSRL